MQKGYFLSVYVLVWCKNYVLKQQLSNAIEIIYEIYNKGYTVLDILDNYFIYIKNTTILNEEQKYIIIPLLCKYITIIHDLHEDEIELAFFTNTIYKKIYKKT